MDLEPLPVSPGPYRLVPLPHPLPPQAGGRVKGLDGPWSPAVLARARALGGEDALLLWPDGRIAETAIAAVLLLRDGEALTPPADGRVQSLAEAHLLPPWAAARGLRIRSTAFGLPDLAGAELWCLNAVRGLWQAESWPPPPPKSP